MCALRAVFLSCVWSFRRGGHGAFGPCCRQALLALFGPVDGHCMLAGWGVWLLRRCWSGDKAMGVVESAVKHAVRNDGLVCVGLCHTVTCTACGCIGQARWICTVGLLERGPLWGVDEAAWVQHPQYR